MLKPCFRFGCLLAAVSLLTPALVLGAEPTEKETPEAVAMQAMTAMKEFRIADFTSLMHPDATKELKRMMLAIIDAAQPEGRGGEVLHLFHGVQSLAQLRTMDDAAFFTAFLQGVLQMQAGFRARMKDMTFEMIGHVADGPDVVHVVYRGSFKIGEVKTTKLSVMSLKEHGSGWRMLLTGDMEGTAAALKREFEVKE